MDYESFIRAKSAVSPASGIEDVPELGEYLFDFQKASVQWALRRGKAALFYGVGLGKSRMEGEFALQASAYLDAIGERSDVLILTPLAVAAQMVRELDACGMRAKYCKTSDDIDPDAFTITNYDRLERFDPRRFGVVILDECFAAGTPIDVPGGRKDIEKICVGDRILNASGIDIVSDVHRREVPYAIRVSIAGEYIICSPRHPFFTSRGWVAAGDLRPGDHALATGAAMRMVQEDVPAQVAEAEIWQVLRSILLSEMAHEQPGTQGKGAQPGSLREKRCVAVSMACLGQSERKCADRSHENIREDAKDAGDTAENIVEIARDEARTFRAWGERNRIDQATAHDARCTRVDLAGGISFVTGPADTGIPDALQAGLGACGTENKHRGGWSLAPHQKIHRRETGCQDSFVRVDGIEILEPGHRDLDKFRDADGKLYFYDIGGTRHPSFSITGVLVHNSSIIKHQTSSTRDKIIKAFSQTPFRLAGTATPAPNDRKELGNHAEFLGVMTLKEMLSEFFVHDSGKTQQWRLKGHAQAHFWRWVASWGAMVTKPSDLGFSDEGYILPPLIKFDHVIPGTMAQSIEIAGEQKQLSLLPEPATNLKTQRKARRVTIKERVATAVEIISAEPTEQWIVWCDLNAEADELEAELAKSLPGAIEIRGSDTPEAKEAAMLGFASGSIQTLITKPRIAGFGLNWQNCARACYVGVTHKFEEVHQSLGRNHRFGQKREVHAHFVYSEYEGNVRANLARKEREFLEMAAEMRGIVGQYVRENVCGLARDVAPYDPHVDMNVPDWLIDRS